MQFKVGDKVHWISSNTAKVGVVIDVVPAGKLPIDLGYKKLDNSGLPRDHESYIVMARKPKYINGRTVNGAGPRGTYWPRANLLSPDHERRAA